MRDKVTRIRQLLQEAAPQPVEETQEAKARRAFAAYAANEDRLFYVDPAPRARAIREVLRIATGYGWPHVVEQALDDAGAMSLTSLMDADLEALLTKLRQFEDCVRNGLDSPEVPPAR